MSRFDVKRVSENLYIDPKGRYYERVTIGKRRSWRRIHSRTAKDAKEELATRRADFHRSKLGLAQNPYTKAPTVLSVLEAYERAGYPDRKGRQRAPRTRRDEVERMKFLRAWWTSQRIEDVTHAEARSYGIHRGGGRAADLDLYTLNNAFLFALLNGLIDRNPLANTRPRFHSPRDTVHCRDRMPASGDELHQLAAALFAKQVSEPIGWQLLLEAMTGCRTSEILDLRTNAADKNTPGFIEGDWIWLKRRKNGTNPFALIHPALKECIAAWRKWHAARFPDHPRWIPHRWDRESSVDTTALTKALARITKELALPHRTSHGLRAYYVTVRRSEGISDAQIAAEIGDATGAAIIAQTYGAVPPNWQGGDALGFLPSDRPPAWNFPFNNAEAPSNPRHTDSGAAV